MAEGSNYHSTDCQREHNTEGPVGPQLFDREWLVTNGLGGYAAGTVAGVPTRRYHGLLIAALSAPSARRMMLNHLTEKVRLGVRGRETRAQQVEDHNSAGAGGPRTTGTAAENIRLPEGTDLLLGGWAHVDGHLDLNPADALHEFCLESGLPVWRYGLGDQVIEKRVFMPHRQNTVCVVYRFVSGEGRVELEIRPWVHFRAHDGVAASDSRLTYCVTKRLQGIEIHGPDLPPLCMRLQSPSGSMVADVEEIDDALYWVERERGYDARGSAWSPGVFRIDLGPGEEATVIASAENWNTVQAIEPEAALRIELQRRAQLLDAAHPRVRKGSASPLVLAADAFIVRPVARTDDACTIIAGYPWFTDWGRDTMISLEGLTLVTGRYAEASAILRGYAQHVREGLIPNLFPEGRQTGSYNTADATLWFFHAIDRYVTTTGDHDLLRGLWPTLQSVIAHHQQGTQFNIHVDPADGLLVQGGPGDQLTWMDAKVGDWVVTPRHGKAVEINALWYNALRLMERWASEEEGEAAAGPYTEAAQRAAVAFNRRFWYEAGGYLYDVVDGDSGDERAMRPNQILAISLPHPILDRPRWSSVVKQVADRLLTPMGLRTLAPGEAEYRPRYTGDLRARDAAYHQGTVWAWLIGPFIDAWCKVHPDQRTDGREFLAGFATHWSEACMGSISEIFDAEAPHAPRGCFAQAWSVAEVLRAWIATD